MPPSDRRNEGEHPGEVARRPVSTTEQGRLCATRRKPHGSRMSSGVGSRVPVPVAQRLVEGLRQQSLVALADDPVAFARDRLQLTAVEHRSRAGAAANQAGALQFACHAGRL
jgi:hypothetical protein